MSKPSRHHSDASALRLIDPRQCPGCRTRVPESAIDLSIYQCRICREWAFDPGVLVIPIMGPAGTPPCIVGTGAPLWKPILPSAITIKSNHSAGMVTHDEQLLMRLAASPQSGPRATQGENNSKLTHAEAQALKAERLANSLGRDDGSLASAATDEQVFEWLINHHDDERVRPLLPESLGAFKRSLGRARSKLGTRKRRRAAPTGRSVVRQQDIEPTCRKDKTDNRD